MNTSSVYHGGGSNKSGWSGGGSNPNTLLGNLTPNFYPRASAPHTLVDGDILETADYSGAAVIVEAATEFNSYGMYTVGGPPAGVANPANFFSPRSNNVFFVSGVGFTNQIAFLAGGANYSSVGVSGGGGVVLPTDSLGDTCIMNSQFKSILFSIGGLQEHVRIAGGTGRILVGGLPGFIVPDAKVVIQTNNLQTGIDPSSGIALENNTPATALIPDQFSPIALFRGAYWDGAVSRNVEGRISVFTNSLGTIKASFVHNLLGLDIITASTDLFGSALTGINGNLTIRSSGASLGDLAFDGSGHFGGGADFTSFMDTEATGFPHFNNNAMSWKDIDFHLIVRATGSGRPVYNPIPGIPQTMLQWAVNDSADADDQEMPHWWYEGSDVTWHVHIITGVSDATDRGVKFKVDWVFADIGAALSVNNTLSSELLIPALTPIRTHFLLPLGVWSPVGLHIGAHVKALGTRIASVTNPAPTVDPFIELMQLHARGDTLGSRLITSK